MRTPFQDAFARVRETGPVVQTGVILAVRPGSVDVNVGGRVLNNVPISEQISWDLLAVNKPCLLLGGVVVSTVESIMRYAYSSDTAGANSQADIDLSGLAHKAFDEEITGKWKFLSPVTFYGGTALIYDQVHVNNGELLVTNATVLSVSLTTTALFILVRDPVFTYDDTTGKSSIIKIRALVNGSIQEEYIRVIGDGKVNGNSYQYAISRAFGGTACAWPVGTALAEVGRSDNDDEYDGGWVSIMGKKASGGGPGIQIRLRNGIGATASTAIYRNGNLQGALGMGEEYGLLVGDWTNADLIQRRYLLFTPRQGFNLRNVTFSQGYEGGPEVRIEQRELNDSTPTARHWSHDMRWFYEPNKVWWSQAFRYKLDANSNVIDRKVFWIVRKPATPTSPETTLIDLLYRHGVVADGEADVDDYFGRINARMLIGDLVAGRVKVTGPLSAMSGDFGELTSGAVIVGTPYTGTPDGFYQWYISPTKTFYDKYATSVEKEDGIAAQAWKFYKAGALQVYYDFNLGRMIYGDATASNPVTAVGSKGLGHYMLTSNTYNTKNMGTYWYKLNGLGSESDSDMLGRAFMIRKSTLDVEEAWEYWLEVFHENDVDTTNLPRSINLWAYGLGEGEHAGITLLAKPLTRQSEMVLSAQSISMFNAKEIFLPGLSFFQEQGFSWWRMESGRGMDLSLSRFMPPTMLDSLSNGEFGGGLNSSNWKIVAARGFAGGAVLLGVDDTLDPNNPRLVVGSGGNQFYLNLIPV